MNDVLLKNFIKVVDTGSFTKAANDSYMTTSALVKQMNQMESELQLKLFYRTNHGIYLTEAGKSYYDDAKFILNYMSSATHKAQLAQNYLMNQTIRVGISILTPINILVKTWNKLCQENISYKMNVVPIDHTMLSAEIILNNLGNNIDCIMDIYNDFLLKKYHCHVLKMQELPIKCAVPKGHSLYSQDKISLQDLKNETVMIYYNDENQYFNKARDTLAEVVSNVQVIDYPSLGASLFNETENNNCIALTLDIWQDIHPFLRVIDIEWNLSIPYGLLYSNKPDEKVEEVVSLLEKNLY